MILAFALLASCWEFVLRHPGLVLVLIGVAGEVACDWNETTGKRAWLKKLFMAVLVAGLAYELIEAAKADKDASSAIERAANAQKQVAGLNLRIEELRSNNIVLEGKMQPRRISVKQMEDFIFLMEKVRKIPIKICVSQEDDETETYAYQIRFMLNKAGFELDSSAGLFGITREQTRRMVTPIGAPTDPSVYFVTSNTNRSGTFVTYFTTEKTNGFERPIFTGNDKEVIYEAVEFGFNKVGIQTRYINSSDWAKPGDYDFFISQKPR